MAGRPTEYTDELPGRVQEYIDSCQDETKQVVVGESEKFTSYKEKVIVKLPSIEGLAAFLGISKDTVYQWEKIHPAFSDVLHTLRTQQAERLINNGLSGDYNPVIAKLLLTKHGYAEKTESEVYGKDGKPIVTETHVKIIRDKRSGTTPVNSASESAEGD
jgi:hypothetical protein